MNVEALIADALDICAQQQNPQGGASVLIDLNRDGTQQWASIEIETRICRDPRRRRESGDYDTSLCVVETLDGISVRETTSCWINDPAEAEEYNGVLFGDIVKIVRTEAGRRGIPIIDIDQERADRAGADAAGYWSVPTWIEAGRPAPLPPAWYACHAFQYADVAIVRRGERAPFAVWRKTGPYASEEEARRAV